MSLKELSHNFEGYAKVKNEIAVLKKYGTDWALQKGEVARYINMYHPKRLSLKVSQIKKETKSTKTFRLVSNTHPLPPFQAGQYINLFVEVNGVRTSRPYSISSSPSQTGYYEITVRRIPQGFVSTYLLDEVKTGDTLQSTAPSGQFTYNPIFHGDNLVFLAGGSGITPFMSMLRDVTDCGLQRQIHLIYGNRITDDIIFKDEMAQLSACYDNVTVNSIISEPEDGYKGLNGFITAEFIKEQVGNLDEKMFYLCGPAAMYTFVQDELKKLGIPKRKIRVEVFGPPADIKSEPGWPEEVNSNESFNVRIKNNITIKAKAGEPLMNSLERAGIVVPAECRSGECSLCRTKLLSGKVFQPRGVKLRESDRTYGYIHPCMAYPLEDSEIMI